MKNIFLVTALLLATHLHAQSVDQVLKRHIESIGGEKNWKKIHSLTTTGEYDYGGMKFPFTAYAKAPNKYKFVVPFNGKYYAQAFDGTNGWKIDAFKNETTTTILTGKEAMAMANEADVELESAFINYKSKGHKATLEEKDTIQNTVCYKVRFTRAGGGVETYYFDVNTFTLMMKESVSKNGEMNGSIIATYYSDYRDVDDIKIPFRAASDINGQAILTITIEKALVNTVIDDKDFQP